MEKIKLNSKGTNANIKANILDDAKMRENGFSDFSKTNWYFCKTVGDDITLNITIPKNGSDIEIVTLDEKFCQPYDYQRILEQDPKFEFALNIKEKVEEHIKNLKKAGILSGHEYGEYI